MASPERIEDVGTAEAAAHGEKKIQEALLEGKDLQGEPLTEVGRKAYMEIADQEAEAAVKEYETTKALDGLKVAALRDLLEGKVGIDPETKLRKWEKEPEKMATIISDTNQALKLFAAAGFDRIIASKESWRDKKELVGHRAGSLEYGAGYSFNDGGGIERSQLIKEVQQNIAAGHSREGTIPSLEGRLAVYLSTEDARGVYDILRTMADMDANDIRPISQVIREMLPVLNQLRLDKPENFEVSATTAYSIDKMMSDEGFLWSPGAKSYIEFAE